MQEAPDVPGTGRRRRRAAVAAVVAVIVLGGGMAARAGLQQASRSDSAVTPVTGEAPPVDLPDLRDPEARVTLASFHGRPVVMNFFASTCVPCRKEMPDFQAVADELGGRVAFVGIDHQDGRAGALDLVAKTGVRYPAGYDPRGTVARAYGLLGLPTTVFVGADGELMARRTGAMSRTELRRTIDRLFFSA